MSAAIGVYLRDTTLTFMKHGQDLSRATLSSFKRSNQYDGAYNGSMRHNPWKIDDGRGGSHDLSWLLQ